MKVLPVRTNGSVRCRFRGFDFCLFCLKAPVVSSLFSSFQESFTDFSSFESSFMNIVNDVLGWGLLILGTALILLVVYGACYDLPFLAMSLSIPATFVFRSGVSFLKMGSAYRLSRHEQSPRSNNMIS